MMHNLKNCNENFQEQEAIRLIVAEILGALMNQKEGGHFILKIFETFTEINLALYDVDAIPSSLSVVAARIPATCVP